MEDLPGWEISSMPGSSPRQHKHERRYTPFTHPFILTRRIWKDDNDGQVIFGDLVGLKLLDICLKGEEKPQKTTPSELAPTGDRTRARCVMSRMLPPALRRWNQKVVECQNYEILVFIQNVTWKANARFVFLTLRASLPYNHICIIGRGIFPPK